MMLSSDRLKRMIDKGRHVEVAKAGDDDLGPLRLLPGVWKNTGDFQGRGWNMIALPFSQAAGEPGYRLLMNQYNEELHFSIADKAVKNRGVGFGGQTGQTDQTVVALDYDQSVTQIAAADSPDSGQAGGADTPIHREPGLWLFMTNETTDGIDIGRLGSVPHGDSLLCMGKSEVIDGPPVIGPINGLPIGVSEDDHPDYFAPYRHFVDTPFKGVVNAPGFPGFSPADASVLLRAGIPGNVKRTTILHVDSTIEQGGIHNIPFVIRQANAVTMNCTFWIMELDERDENGEPKVLLQYAQSILLDFFGRKDGNPGRVQWPHVSINTLERVSAPKPSPVQMDALS